MTFVSLSLVTWCVKFLVFSLQSSIEDGYATIHASHAESPLSSDVLSEDLYHPSSYQPPSLCRRMSLVGDIEQTPEESVQEVGTLDTECEADVSYLATYPL